MYVLRVAAHIDTEFMGFAKSVNKILRNIKAEPLEYIDEEVHRMIFPAKGQKHAHYMKALFEMNGLDQDIRIMKLKQWLKYQNSDVIRYSIKRK